MLPLKFRFVRNEALRQLGMRTKWPWIRLLARAMHNLIIRPPNNLPVSWLRWMLREEITHGISSSAILFPVDYVRTEVFIFLRKYA